MDLKSGLRQLAEQEHQALYRVLAKGTQPWHQASSCHRRGLCLGDNTPKAVYAASLSRCRSAGSSACLLGPAGELTRSCHVSLSKVKCLQDSINQSLGSLLVDCSETGCYELFRAQVKPHGESRQAKLRLPWMGFW